MRRSGNASLDLGKYEEAEIQIRKGTALLKNTVEHEYALRQRYLGDALLAQGKWCEAMEAYQYSLNYFLSVSERTWIFTSLTGISRAAIALGDRSGAWKAATQALQLYRDGKVFNYFVYPILGVLAVLLADSGEITQALEFYETAVIQPNLAQSLWFADLYSQFIAEFAKEMPLEGQKSANGFGQNHDLSWVLQSLKSTVPNTAATQHKGFQPTSHKNLIQPYNKNSFDRIFHVIRKSPIERNIYET